jgi:hypothetical protein
VHFVPPRIGVSTLVAYILSLDDTFVFWPYISTCVGDLKSITLKPDKNLISKTRIIDLIYLYIYIYIYIYIYLT